MSRSQHSTIATIREPLREDGSATPAKSGACGVRGALAQLPSVTRQAEQDRLRGEIMELATTHSRLLELAFELRELGMAFSASRVRADARFIAHAIASRAKDLGYGLARIANVAERARRERSPLWLISRNGS